MKRTRLRTRTTLKRTKKGSNKKRSNKKSTRKRSTRKRDASLVLKNGLWYSLMNNSRKSSFGSDKSSIPAETKGNLKTVYTFTQEHEGKNVKFSIDTRTSKIQCNDGEKEYNFTIDKSTKSVIYEGNVMCKYDEVDVDVSDALHEHQEGGTICPLCQGEFDEPVTIETDPKKDSIGFFTPVGKVGKTVFTGIGKILRFVTGQTMKFIFWLIVEILKTCFNYIKGYLSAVVAIGLILQFFVPGGDHVVSTILGYLWDPSKTGVTDVAMAVASATGQSAFKIGNKFIFQPALNFITSIPLTNMTGSLPFGTTEPFSQPVYNFM